MMKLHLGDNIEILKQYPDNSIDAIVTDCPYGLGEEPDAVKLLQDWVSKGYHEVSNKAGFMNKEWDAFVPQPIFWKEAFRVLKHGGHVLAFYGTRTYDIGVMAMRLAGFEIRDRIQFCFDGSNLKDEFIDSLREEQRILLGSILKNGDNECFFAHGVGFPKGQNISIAIDKKLGKTREVIETKTTKSGGMHSVNKLNKEQGFRPSNYNEDGNVFEITAPASEEAKLFFGFSTQLKPANEPIVLCRKPLQVGMTIAENVLEYSTGGMNIGACRIGHNEEQKFANREQRSAGWNPDNCGFDSTKNNTASANPLGRYPANVVMQHSEDCECVGTKKVKGSNCKPSDIGKGREGDFSNGIFGEKKSKVTVSHTDEEGFEEVEEWKCVEDCPIRILDEQSGITKSTGGKNSKGGLGKGGRVYSKFTGGDGLIDNLGGLGDTGGASRFYYTSKASKKERNYGLPEGETNWHPTVKSLSLMSWLVKLITPIGGVCLDPFMGSGSTGIAAVQSGYDFIGIEMEEHSFKTAEARINFAVKEREENIEKEKSKVTQTGLF